MPICREAAPCHDVIYTVYAVYIYIHIHNHSSIIQRQFILLLSLCQRPLLYPKWWRNHQVSPRSLARSTWRWRRRMPSQSSTAPWSTGCPVRRLKRKALTVSTSHCTVSFTPSYTWSRLRLQRMITAVMLVVKAVMSFSKRPNFCKPLHIKCNTVTLQCFPYH